MSIPYAWQNAISRFFPEQTTHENHLYSKDVNKMMLTNAARNVPRQPAQPVLPALQPQAEQSQFTPNELFAQGIHAQRDAAEYRSEQPTAVAPPQAAQPPQEQQFQNPQQSRADGLRAQRDPREYRVAKDQRQLGKVEWGADGNVRWGDGQEQQIYGQR